MSRLVEVHRTCVLGFAASRRHILHKQQSSQDSSLIRRMFWRIVDDICNRYEHEKVALGGPDRACAEWLVMCGAQVRWKDTGTWHSDYNKLPGASQYKYKIEEINADNAQIMSQGFAYFKDVSSIKRMRIHKCPYIDDDAIQNLGRALKTLEFLELSSLDVSDKGISSLTQMRNLKSLLLFDLPEVKDKNGCKAHIEKALPDCKVDYRDIKK